MKILKNQNIFKVSLLPTKFMNKLKAFGGKCPVSSLNSLFNFQLSQKIKFLFSTFCYC